MYEEFYGLNDKPFSLLPDASFLFLSKHHKRVINLLEYGTLTQAGFMVVTGEVGAGKTTIVRRFLKSLGPEVAVGVITNPSTMLGRLLVWIANAFDLPARGHDDTEIYNLFIEYLLAQYAQGKRTVLIVDEAQNLTIEMLEELRMLSNVNNEKDLLLQMVLVGQPELVDTLKRPELRQFVQRIAVHCHLGLLSPADTAGYIRHRLAKVGGAPDIFDDKACALIYYFTGGVPRLINLICDQSLVYGFSGDLEVVTFDVVAEVAIDRGRYGLSAFRNVPEVFSAPELEAAIQDPLAQIRLAEKG